MSIDIREEALTLTALEGHAAVPIAFVADRMLEVMLIDGGLEMPASSGGCYCLVFL